MSDICPIPDEIRRSARKTLGIEVTADGRLIVHAPRLMSRSRIDSFLTEKAEWIIKKQQAATMESAVLPPVADGETWQINGQAIHLCLDKNVSRAVRCEGIDVLLLPADNAKAALIAWLKEQAKVALIQKTQAWAARMGVSVATVKLTNAQKQWGSCNSKGVVHLHWSLICCPCTLTDYVIVHELCHRRYMNHSPRFWQEVATFCPDWRECRKQLSAYRFLLRWEAAQEK